MPTFLSRYALIGLMTFAFGVVANSQPIYNPKSDDAFAAPVEWKQYRVPGQNLSISIPKLPVVRETNDQCSQSDGASYTAYAGEAVYEFAWHALSGKPVPKSCSSTERFGQKQYFARADALRLLKSVNETDVKIMGSPAKMFRSELDASVSTHWLLWDIDRWFEMTVTRRKDAVAREDSFVSSLSLADDKAVEIGAGSDSTLGDRSGDEVKHDESQPASSPQGIVIVSKPRPVYSEEARKKRVTGTVILRVTFLKNGGIGEIVVVKTADDGLAEQAIAAARRISFLPQFSNGTSETVTKQLEYTFSIY